ncbi:hypothetical protein [Microbacterium sp. AG1240]|nr:hypothetical protein [Microbacterium sp. AG1240]
MTDSKNPNSTDSMSQDHDSAGAGSESPEEGKAAMADAEEAVED